MFDPKKEVPSLELCKKLKELGYPQDGGGWYWVKIKKRWRLCLDNDRYNSCWEKVEEVIKAPTVAEMESVMPDEIVGDTIKDCCLFWRKDGDKGNLFYRGVFLNETLHEEKDRKPDAYAKMVIWLIEKDYVSFEREGE